ncbi:RING-H2 finger protein ATL7-like [Nicotiana tabacum]|uniref:RING-type E3 ubiquitin transferase n=2 Tax=Nicotiana TaxID=4085 RepID=A0A1S3ZVT3_TOBAC|nr:PREDICTED: RING-H2 finger protein ATL7-like [Nicotiana sylvestris]XP_016468540.1 PREDICTED: RING-H2 finger protein ATL7-like [Nicotiana tabacum]
MSVAGKGYPDLQENSGITSNNASSNCCSEALAQLKIYQAFIFSIPIFFVFILLLLFYLFYLRRRRVDWSSLRMRTSTLDTATEPDELSQCELGLKKEVREMLPIIVFKQSFSVNDTQCSVCLGDYEAEDKLQQIPACGHTFHMDCIDHWLVTHNTCPLCRRSILAPTKANTEETPDRRAETTETNSTEQDADETSHQRNSDCSEGPQVGQSNPKPETREETEERSSNEEEGDSHNVDNVMDSRKESNDAL